MSLNELTRLHPIGVEAGVPCILMVCAPLSEVIGQPLGSIIPDPLLHAQLQELPAKDDNSLDLRWRCERSGTVLPDRLANDLAPAR